MTDNCPICFEGICDMALNCGHKVHEECLSQMIHQSDPECRITYSPIKCPLCRVVFEQDIGKINIQGILEVCRQAEDIGTKQLQKDYEEKEVIEILLEKSILEVAIIRRCQACTGVYFDGYSSCAARIPNEDENDLGVERVYRCRGCNSSEKGKSCEQHGYSFGVMKCIYCCVRVATYHCGGEFYCCTPCHGDLRGTGVPGFTPLECPGDDTCLFYGIDFHPLNGGAQVAFMLNCGACGCSVNYNDVGKPSEPNDIVVARPVAPVAQAAQAVRREVDYDYVDGVGNLFQMYDRNYEREANAQDEYEYGYVEGIGKLFNKYDRIARRPNKERVR